MHNVYRLISATALLNTETFSVSEGACKECENEYRLAVMNAPTVDAMEVVHGRWKVLARFFDGSLCTQCSICGEEYTYKTGRFEHINAEYAKYNYCPNCGAKMDLE